MFDLTFKSAQRTTASCFPSPLPTAPKTPVVLVDRCALSREGLAQALREGPFIVVASEDDVANVRLPAEAMSGPLLVIRAMSGDEIDDPRPLRAVQARFPDCAIVVFCPDCAPEKVTAMLRLGAMGVLTDPDERDGIIGALELVTLGHYVVPLDAVASCLDLRIDEPVEAITAAALGDPGRREPELGRLSVREVEILLSLLAGEQNRCIARRLSITEATVKVHVKAILRKIKAQNRTQAAIWALNRIEKLEAYRASGSGMG
jgi:two-component system nitrate/nitrite response regulator NarL